jgi:multicomponent Na+:H+ antiporter subunit G
METVLVDALLAIGVAAELICCIGVAAARTTADRLHYAAAGTTVGPFAILAALLVREGLTSQGLQAIATVAILFVAGPIVTHATARAVRRVDYGDLQALPEERADP